MLTSWVPMKAFILALSSSIAAFDSSCKLSMNPLERPSYWAREALTSWRCSYCFLTLIWFFSRTSILSSSSLISSSYFSLLKTNVFKRSSLILISSSAAALILFTFYSAWSSSFCICILSARITFTSSSCILFMLSIIAIKSLIYLSLELAR